jgi:hypothetical protein
MKRLVKTMSQFIAESLTTINENSNVQNWHFDEPITGGVGGITVIFKDSTAVSLSDPAGMNPQQGVVTFRKYRLGGQQPEGEKIQANDFGSIFYLLLNTLGAQLTKTILTTNDGQGKSAAQIPVMASIVNNLKGKTAEQITAAFGKPSIIAPHGQEIIANYQKGILAEFVQLWAPAQAGATQPQQGAQAGATPAAQPQQPTV